MSFDRGFKAHANRVALEVRRDLNIDAVSPICPWTLADSLCLPVIPLLSLAKESHSLARQVRYLAYRQPRVFSAMTVFHGARRIIIHNDAHAPVRQRSNLAHELAHALLMHPPHPPFCTDGSRIFDRRLEAEAGWLGAVLLVPNEAARWAMAHGKNERDAAHHFGVSVDLIRFRLRTSGALRILDYSKS